MFFFAFISVLKPPCKYGSFGISYILNIRLYRIYINEGVPIGRRKYREYPYTGCGDEL
jgi:hypothetical protein